MSEVNLAARTGRSTGSRESRRIRREGGVPAIVYGHGREPVAVTVDAIELSRALNTDAGSNALISLDLGDETVTTMAREVERHPFRREYRHVDFVEVSLTDTLEAEVHLEFVGEAVGTVEGGVFSPSRSTALIEALATSIPNYIEVDVSALEIGDALRIEDLPVVEGVTYLDDPDLVVCAVTVPISEEELEAAVEAVAGEEEEEELEAAEGEEEELEAAEGEEAEAGDDDDASEGSEEDS
ncbi:MAG: 50S ribosomal protein L25 [Acidimicrobiia bacterium]|nr:50S ribosomal protein L25 [Acidimicrobiia bacterium]